jgi:hypothetical protein
LTKIASPPHLRLNQDIYHALLAIRRLNDCHPLRAKAASMSAFLEGDTGGGRLESQPESVRLRQLRKRRAEVARAIRALEALAARRAVN